MKKIAPFLALSILCFSGLLFAQEADGFSDDFDDIFAEAPEDIQVEQTSPVVPAADSTASKQNSFLSFTGHLGADLGLACVVTNNFDFGGYFDFKNILYMNVRPSSNLSLHGSLTTSFENKFTLDLSSLYLDYMAFDRLFISVGKKDVAWGYTRLFPSGNIMGDTNNSGDTKVSTDNLNAELRLPWRTGTATFVGSYNYGKKTEATAPGYKDITYALSIEQTIGHTSLNLFGKYYGNSQKELGGVNKNPLAGLEVKRTIAGFDFYAQGLTRFADYIENVQGTCGFYRLWDNIIPNFGINIEYQYIWTPDNASLQAPEHSHVVMLEGGIKRIGKKKNMKCGINWKHDFNSNDGKVEFAYIIDGVFPYASWKNAVSVTYEPSVKKTEAVIGSVISIALDY